MQTARAAHVGTVCPRLDVVRFHLLDETALPLDYTRRYARAPGGQRVSGTVPLTRGRSLTLIGALSVNGLGAVQVLEGALTQHRFAWYVTQCLAPTLQRGAVLVLDNASAHKLDGVTEWLAERGVERLFLPPYSPDLTPVEQAWSKFKIKLRAAKARTREALEQALYEALDWITSADALSWFGHCGYHIRPA